MRFRHRCQEIFFLIHLGTTVEPLHGKMTLRLEMVFGIQNEILDGES